MNFRMIAASALTVLAFATAANATPYRPFHTAPAIDGKCAVGVLDPATLNCDVAGKSTASHVVYKQAPTWSGGISSNSEIIDLSNAPDVNFEANPSLFNGNGHSAN